jgi:alginate O-acetyltransferase complex protein AlgI
VAYTLLVVLVGWVPFRADDLGHAGSFVAALIGSAQGDGVAHHVALYLTPDVALTVAAGVIGCVPVLPALGRLRDQMVEAAARPVGLARAIASAELAGLAVVLVSCAARLAARTYNPFVYFRF